MDYLQLLFALPALVFALLAMASSRKCAQHLTVIREVAASLRSARSRIEAHDSEIEALADSLQTLRGKFYASRRTTQQTDSSSDSREEAIGAATPTDEASRVAWKQRMRAKYGLTPSPRP